MNASLIRRFLARLLLALGFFVVAVPAARADALDDFLGLYGKIESEVGYQLFPGFSAAELQGLKGYLRCLANGGNAIQCAAESNAPIPAELDKVIDAYVAYAHGDYWGAAYALGSDIVCIVVKILTATDVCALLEAIYEAAKAVYDAVAAVLDFLADVGKAVCEGIGLCDEDEGLPLHEVISNNIYTPRVKNGVEALESASATAYKPELLAKLRSDAISYANQSYSAVLGMLSAQQKQEFLNKLAPHIEASVNVAEQKYLVWVDSAWTDDIANRVMPLLSAKRSAYMGQDVSPVAQLAANQFLQSNTAPDGWIRKRCRDDFANEFGFVDRWVSAFPVKAGDLQIKNHMTWCKDVFWEGGKPKFANAFREFAKTKICTSAGDAIVCDALDKYEKCTGLLSSVGKSDECRIDKTNIGKAAAQRIEADFKAQGSVIPCKTVLPPMAVYLPNTPAPLVQFECSRPTQQLACEQSYQKFYGALPTKVLNCSLKESPDYVMLKNAVQKAVTGLNAQYGPYFVLMLNGSVDPLAVNTERSDVLAQVQQAPQQNWGFGPPSAKPGFDYGTNLANRIDGLSTPRISLGLDQGRIGKIEEGKVKGVVNKVDAADLLKRANNPVINPMDTVREGAAGLSHSQGGATPAMEKAAQSPSAKAPGMLMGAAGGSLLQSGAGAPVAKQQVMSGSLPPQNAPPPAEGGGRMMIQSPGGSPLVASAAGNMGQQPDLAIAGSPAVNGMAVMWGGSLQVDAGQSAAKSASGQCLFMIDFAVRNQGQGESGAFSTVWSNTAIPGGRWQESWPSLAPGGERRGRASVGLQPGLNVLRLVVDDLSQVSELNEANNMGQLTLNLTGSCSSMPAPMMRGGGLPPMPQMPPVRQLPMPLAK